MITCPGCNEELDYAFTHKGLNPKDKVIIEIINNSHLFLTIKREGKKIVY